jgi:hypothetical protein
MQFNKIEEIQVGGNKNGIVESDGNVFAIVSADYSQSYDQSPSKLSLSLVGVDSASEMKEYLGILADGKEQPLGKQNAPFSNRNIETIKVIKKKDRGEDEDIVVFSFSGFLVSFSESISAGERTYQIEYINRSVILDKIFVGLSNRHMRIAPEWGHGSLVKGSVTATALCGPMSKAVTDTLLFGGDTGIGPRLQTARVWDANLKKSYIPYYSFSDEEYYAGGRIIVGDEQFSENFCSIHTVDYTFKDLVDGMESAGISCAKQGFLAFSKNGLRREYSGTLRSVLSSWCAEYGLFYLWEDPKPNQEEPETSKHAAVIKFYDMREGVGNISGLKEDMLSIGVEDIQFSQTCENTKFTNLVTRFVKPPSINEQTINFSWKVPCTPITLRDINDASRVNNIIRPKVYDGIAADSFLVSCALAKANEDLRTLWYIGNSFGALGDDKSFRWEALGIYIVRHKGHDGKLEFSQDGKDILKGGYIEEYGEIERSFSIDSMTGFNMDNLDVYLVYRSDDMASRFLDWEKDIANNFIGKYWKTTWTTRQKDTSSCSAIYGRRSKIADSNPPFVDNSDKVIPEVSIDPYGSPISAGSGASMNRTVKRDSAQWGTNLVIDKASDTKTYVPRFVPVTLEYYDVLVESGVIDEGDVDLDFRIGPDSNNMGGATFQLGFLFVRRDTRKMLSISAAITENPLETPDSVINGRIEEGDVKNCTPTCSVNIAEYICKGTSQNGSNLQPSVLSNRSLGVFVDSDKDTLGVTGVIYTPVGSLDGPKTKFNRIETIDYSNFLSRRGLKHFYESWSKFSGDDNLGPLQSAHVDVVDEDMANGVVYTSDMANTLINGSSYIVRDGRAESLGSIETDGTIGGYVIPDALRMYSEDIKKALPSGASKKNQSLSATLAGKHFSQLSNKFSLDEGLSSLSFSFGSSGSTTKVSFRSVPKQLVNKEKVIPLIKTLTTHFRN